MQSNTNYCTFKWRDLPYSNIYVIKCIFGVLPEIFLFLQQYISNDIGDISFSVLTLMHLSKCIQNPVDENQWISNMTSESLALLVAEDSIWYSWPRHINSSLESSFVAKTTPFQNPPFSNAQFILPLQNFIKLRNI